jgi:hypothetical protein
MDELPDQPDSELPLEPVAASANPRANVLALQRGRRVRAVVASIVSTSGLALLFICGLEWTGNLPSRLPHFWYPVRYLWPIVGAILWYTGTRLANADLDWSPKTPGRRFDRVFLYTRQGCHLCDEAMAILMLYDAYLPPITEIDIDRDAVLIAKFTECVPVVEIDGKIRFRGKIDEILLRRLIEGTQPNS